ncbi:glycosyltransferase WbuB [Marinobacter orientalis]|uniref:Glycosyltransferase family 4 protein n=1 Tax=Marinobacter orientalis TaxID=1928859 RepID=A0A7Y0RFF6_9GAMM|nr:glycosyltransferase family 4 protein [Marinobacter orientalis]NMT65223.1 glycosyltransferase family 4 protein [Marinobacter orientalis]TGX48008.1 glycosyltransferase WbuB [Marinobacter orientalis]
MKILLLSYYFPPDLSAGAFRARALAEALVRQGGGNVQLDVLTTEPNRYRSHKPVAVEKPEIGYRVVRVGLPRQRWGLLGQVRSFGSFARAAFTQAPEDHYDIVVATSSRLMTAAVGARLAKRKGAVYYLDIRDIFLDTIRHVFNPAVVMPLKGLLSRIERYAVRRANRVNLVSPGFLPYFQKIDAKKSYRLFTNGIDEDFELEAFVGKSPATGKVHIVYAGNIGHGQGLDHILPPLALQLEGRASFTVIGDGATRAVLVNRCREVGADVTFVNPVPRDQLLGYYKQADVLFLHLNDLPAFLKVLPSKLFEYAATGKPILAGVDGYSRGFLAEQVEGVGIFRPCDVTAAIEAFDRLELVYYPRKVFLERYARRRIMDDMARDVLEIG